MYLYNVNLRFSIVVVLYGVRLVKYCIVFCVVFYNNGWVYGLSLCSIPELANLPTVVNCSDACIDFHKLVVEVVEGLVLMIQSSMCNKQFSRNSRYSLPEMFEMYKF